MALGFEDKRVDVKRVEQQRSFYCGPASSEMFLSHFNVPSIQAVAYEEIQKFNVEPNDWYSDPDGLAKYVSASLADNIFQDIDDYVSGTFEQALNKLYYTIAFLKIPCITLVLEGGHWVVVDGIRFKQEPNKEPEIVGFYVRDPYPSSPDFSYVSLSEFSKSKFLPNKVGDKWKDKYVILSKQADQGLLGIKGKDIMPKAGGGAMDDPVEIALQNLELQGFDKVAKVKGGGAAVLKPVEVEGLDGASSYTIVLLDATETPEFQDYIYVAIDKNKALLETTTQRNALQIYNDDEMKIHLEQLFPGKTIKIIKGCFWKPSFELRSRLAVARRFNLDEKDMFLLPNGTVAESLTGFTKGG
ncbi:MAG TPA: hypothetical protein VE956_06115 [Nodularia sp. (in: cyanobacteria)]|nr:hypothetical protein [Nodularia sp. (in: cyanobacteria)]